MRSSNRTRSTVRTAAVPAARPGQLQQAILVLAAACALFLIAALSSARADTWVTINPDGSITRTQTAPAPAPAPNIYVQNGNTTFYSGTYYPVPVPRYPDPRYPAPYSYYDPGGVTYPIGPEIPGFHSPTITTLPSSGVVYGRRGRYPRSYPHYGSTGTYYSGPTGGGGTVYSHSTTKNSGFSGSVGSGGWSLNLGKTERSSTSTTTVTTSR